MFRRIKEYFRWRREARRLKRLWRNTHAMQQAADVEDEQFEDEEAENELEAIDYAVDDALNKGMSYVEVIVAINDAAARWCLKQGLKDVKAGRLHDHEDVRREFGQG